MRRSVRQTAAPLFAMLFALAACAGTPDAVRVDDGAYVRLPAVPGNPAAAYLTVRGGATADRLVAIGSGMAARVELHASMLHGGMMTMAPLTGVDIPAHGAVAFAPAGRHVMLFGLPAAVGPGTQVPFTLRFRSGAVVGLTARAIAAGDAAPD
ncbi:MAG TPA: copper chaperone PCu(A)C [Sphingomonas sp.]|jgi:hypothetical protein|uniref:copper chaperone PCu(A)C n=1 Tax=Sphingomonas sp. TaxID=28214 RepID=UPI002ED826CF